MKKTKLILLILCISLIISTLPSCSSKEPEPLDPLSDELKEEIVAAAEEKWGNEMWLIWGSLGVFDGDKIAVYCENGAVYPAFHTEKVAGKKFEYFNIPDRIYIYHNSDFIELSEAYPKIVSRKEVNDIYYYYNEFCDKKVYEKDNQALLEYLILDNGGQMSDYLDNH